ncbi:putative ucrQ family protein [Lyophyllum shimeji]|uniref:Cytochrome b-c1 complex subunit 8 n=1 Tax=Lyophyllum shimeji TaxID=47721 RepID=A0A9P3UVL7_LYOSH|nr:putative ucrQ family protein [Lyophyllum shimeji]
MLATCLTQMVKAVNVKTSDGTNKALWTTWKEMSDVDRPHVAVPVVFVLKASGDLAGDFAETSYESNKSLSTTTTPRRRVISTLSHKSYLFTSSSSTMRPSIARLGAEMPGPKTYNVWWGDKSGMQLKNITQYTLSPFQQRVAKNLFRNYLIHGYERISRELIFWVIPFAVGYATYEWANRTDYYYKSKASRIERIKQGREPEE